jgi:predicted amidohydrolase YtcJ
MTPPTVTSSQTHAIQSRCLQSFGDVRHHLQQCFSLLLLIAIATISGCSRSDDQPAAGMPASIPPADLVMLNGAIYGPATPEEWSEALVITGNKLSYVGSADEARQYIGPETEVLDLDGRMVLPGFHDAHTHSMLGGRMLTGCSLEGLASVEAILEKIDGCNNETPEGWLLADNWNVSLFGADGPNKALLDTIAPDRPVRAFSSDGHHYWVNSKALELAGIDTDFADPPGGKIERDELGAPSGTLRESAMQLIDDLVPVPTTEENEVAIRAAIQAMNAVGITSIFDAWAASADINAYKALEDKGELSVRTRVALAYPYSDVFALDTPEVYEDLLAHRDDYTTDRFVIGSVKLYIDGVLEGETADLVDPYLGMGDYRGSQYFGQDELNRIVAELEKEGLQVHTHAIGDGAVREILNAFENARKQNGPGDFRHHISHLQLIHPDDLDRFAELGVVANFQALWAILDEWITELNLPVVGQERVDRMYPIGSIVRSGAMVVGGSDWNVSSMNPLDAIEVGVLRSDPNTNGSNAEAEQPPPAVLNADESVSLKIMIDAYTRNAAWSMHQEDLTGSLEPGKRADIVVLDRNLFEIPPEEINEAQVVMTLLDGEVVYELQER